MKKTKENRGITLIALVITIIVLLILAGVSIASLTGENGILTQAQKAQKMTKEAEIKEENDIYETEDKMNELISGAAPIVRDENPGTLEGMEENAEETEETGTEENPYEINSIEDLVAFSNQVNAGNDFSGKYVKLMKSLNFNSNNSYADPTTKEFGDVNLDGKIEGLKIELSSGQGFVPIGNYNSDPIPFAGTFLGNKKYIKNLYINVVGETGEFDTGLFGYNTGTIQDVYVLDCDIYVKMPMVFVGGIAGVQDGKVFRCGVSGKLEGNAVIGENNISVVGGIGGQSSVEGENAEIKDCYNLAKIYSKNDTEPSKEGEFERYLSNANAAGILGMAVLQSQNILNCYNRGEIVSETKQMAIAGGIIGMIGVDSEYIFIGVPGFENVLFGGNVSNCYNAGMIRGVGAEDFTFIGSAIGNTVGNTNINNIYGIGDNRIIGEIGTDEDFPNTITNAQIKTSTQLKSSDIISLLGDGFKKDSGKKNGGYPLLAWQ